MRVVYEPGRLRGAGGWVGGEGPGVDCGSAEAARFSGLVKAASAKNKSWLTRYADRARTGYSILQTPA